MPLIEVGVPAAEVAVPGAVRAFLRDADRRIDEFQLRMRAPAFVPSDYEGAHTVLAGLADSTAIRGRCFCEWGSGFGVVAGLAAFLGFDAHGIEVETDLVAEARQLADDHDLPIEYAAGSFVPRTGEERVSAAGNYSWLTTEASDAYEDLGLDPSDFDVVYAYPWPDEEAITAELFERYAGAGAVLVTYHGGDNGFRVRRKVRKRATNGARRRA